MLYKYLLLPNNLPHLLVRFRVSEAMLFFQDAALELSHHVEMTQLSQVYQRRHLQRLEVSPVVQEESVQVAVPQPVEETRLEEIQVSLAPDSRRAHVLGPVKHPLRVLVFRYFHLQMVHARRMVVLAPAVLVQTQRKRVLHLLLQL